MDESYSIEQLTKELGLSLVEIEKYIRKTPNKQEWCVYSADGTRKLGCHTSYKSALEQLQAVEASKYRAQKMLMKLSNLVSGLGRL